MGLLSPLPWLIALLLQAIPTSPLPLEFFRQKKGPVLCLHFLSLGNMHHVLLRAVQLSSLLTWWLNRDGLQISRVQVILLQEVPKGLRREREKNVKCSPLPCKLFTEFSQRISSLLLQRLEVYIAVERQRMVQLLLSGSIEIRSCSFLQKQVNCHPFSIALEIQKYSRTTE